MWKSGKGIDRRNFLAGAAGAAVSFSIIKPSLVKGDESNSKLNIAIIGCGGRGTWIANLFHNHGGYNIVAAGDYFEDQVNRFGGQCRVGTKDRYTGLSCYKKILERDDVDAVVIESPPYFHPEQTAAAIDAGKHVFLAKPIAVDVPGCQSIAQSGKKATEKKLCLLVDFQTRADEYFKQAVKKVHYGDIGKLFLGEAVYHSNGLRRKIDESGTAEARLRNWVYDKAYSGDIITEQNIHTLDVAAWIIGADPISAMGTGGRKVRTHVGDCWDHFAAIYKFPNDITLSFNSKQCGDGHRGIMCRMYGAKGTIEAWYAGKVFISGEMPYPGGENPGLYDSGAAANIATFYDNVTGGNFVNPTVPESVRSTMTTVLGRTAAYRHGEASWDEIIKADEKIEIDTKGLKA